MLCKVKQNKSTICMLWFLGCHKTDLKYSDNVAALNLYPSKSSYQKNNNLIESF